MNWHLKFVLNKITLINPNVSGETFDENQFIVYMDLFANLTFCTKMSKLSNNNVVELLPTTPCLFMLLFVL